MNILLTGPPGVGKTTIVWMVIERLAVPIAGFLTREIREHKRRAGFEVAALDTGETAVLAHVQSNSSFRVGRYGVAVEAMTRVAVPALHRALGDAEPLSTCLIVIDEIGRMECSAFEFMQAVLACLDSPQPVLGVIQEGRLPFLCSIRERDDVDIVEVNPRNRDRLVEEVTKRLAVAAKVGVERSQEVDGCD